MKAMIWLLVWCSEGCYIGVEARDFDTKESCRKWAIEKLETMKNLPEVWWCESREKPRIKTILEREKS
jgi:hypothetical protein